MLQVTSMTSVYDLHYPGHEGEGNSSDSLLNLSVCSRNKVPIPYSTGIGPYEF